MSVQFKVCFPSLCVLILISPSDFLIMKRSVITFINGWDLPSEVCHGVVILLGEWLSGWQSVAI